MLCRVGQSEFHIFPAILEKFGNMHKQYGFIRRTYESTGREDDNGIKISYSDIQMCFMFALLFAKPHLHFHHFSLFSGPQPRFLAASGSSLFLLLLHLRLSGSFTPHTQTQHTFLHITHSDCTSKHTSTISFIYLL